MFKKSMKLFLILVAMLSVTLAAVTNDAYAGNGKPGVLPPHAGFRGMSYGEWARSWWQALFAIPVVDDDHPYISGGAFEGEKGVMYLAAVVGAPATVDVMIPAGTPLFVPVINAECSVIEPDPFHGEDETSLRACANGHIDNTSGRSAELDGKPVQNLDAYRVQSPLFEFGPLPENNLLAFFGLDAPAGAVSPSVDAGVYLLIKPLSVGHHVLRIRATFDDLGASIDTTFNLTVVPNKP